MHTAPLNSAHPPPTVPSSIPAAPSPAAAASAAPTGPFPGTDLPEGEARRGLRILVAEDVLENQALIEGLLERFGHSLVMVANGREAVDAFDKEEFDVILMDMQMPLMGGLEATCAIRSKESRDGGHTPIIALTAHAMKATGKGVWKPGWTIT